MFENLYLYDFFVSCQDMIINKPCCNLLIKIIMKCVLFYLLLIDVYVLFF